MGYRCHSLDADVGVTSTPNDAGIGVLLWRYGKKQVRPKYDDDVLRGHGANRRHLRIVGVVNVVWF